MPKAKLACVHVQCAVCKRAIRPERTVLVKVRGKHVAMCGKCSGGKISSNFGRFVRVPRPGRGFRRGSLL